MKYTDVIEKLESVGEFMEYFGLHADYRKQWNTFNFFESEDHFVCLEIMNEPLMCVADLEDISICWNKNQIIVLFVMYGDCVLQIRTGLKSRNNEFCHILEVSCDDGNWIPLCGSGLYEKFRQRRKRKLETASDFICLLIEKGEYLNSLDVKFTEKIYRQYIRYAWERYQDNDNNLDYSPLLDEIIKLGDYYNVFMLRF